MTAAGRRREEAALEGPAGAGPRHERFDVVAVGSALVDVLAPAEERQLADLGLVKGSMRLVDLEEAERLYSVMGPAIEVSGGSAGNTAVGSVALGSKAAYLARVADDTLGRVFVHDIRSAGVNYSNQPVSTGPATGRCLIFITADAERTMCTYLGAAAHLGSAEILPELISGARVVYLEGYLWDLEPAKEALRLAIDIAHREGAQVALSLSDPFCVERHREEFLELVEARLDVVFCNEAEARLLYGTDDLDCASRLLGKAAGLGVVTMGERGSMAVTADQMVEVRAAPTSAVVDTTGAGDLYSAGFLHGLAHGADLTRCARLGSLAAAEVISHVGARPQHDLRLMAEEASLL